MKEFPSRSISPELSPCENGAQYWKQARHNGSHVRCAGAIVDTDQTPISTYEPVRRSDRTSTARVDHENLCSFDSPALKKARTLPPFPLVQIYK
ncbi:hypothetical protein EVAR_49498_1 [Eumeta japonica]|uniref:Uncharacterized protein n=1 Tax=Eumeta variegata TaxID=151549 RepID=A0A4C1VWP8_EUMVA|nr:hypothetical protein EVAR_49498_1 [Eumeta japonica]